MQIPVITRVYVTASILTTLAVQLSLVTPIQLLYHPQLVLRGEVWRLVTTFMFFGPVGISLIFNMLFLYRFCRKLEETSFAGNTAGFIVMLFFGASVTLVIATLFVRMMFMGEALTTMLVYVWCRRNPFVRYSFFGLFTFQAPYLPWLLILLSVLFGGSVMVDLVGIAVGHVYYFLEDVFPSKPGGFKILKTPTFLGRLCDGPQGDTEYIPPPEERPGGFAWGEGREQ